MVKNGVAETIHDQNFAQVTDLWPERLEACIPNVRVGMC